MKASQMLKRIGKRVELRLYVTNSRAPSLMARDNAERLCKEVMAGHCRLEVIDLAKKPQVALQDQVVVTPTLVRRYPRPEKRVIGDLSKTALVLAGLGLHPGAG